MAAEGEKKFASGLRQGRISSLRTGGGLPQSFSAFQSEEEEGEDEEFIATETIESPAKAKRVGGVLRKTRRKASATIQQAGAKLGKLMGRGQKVLATAMRSGGGFLISFGAGLGFTLIGLIIGLPAILLGIIFFVIGILGTVSGEATVIASKAVEERAKAKAKKKKEAGGGGGIIPSVGAGGGAAVTTAKMGVRLILAPLKILGCSMVGFVGGVFLLGVVVVAILLLILETSPVATVIESGREMITEAYEAVSDFIGL